MCLVLLFGCADVPGSYNPRDYDKLNVTADVQACCRCLGIEDSKLSNWLGPHFFPICPVCLASLPSGSCWVEVEDKHHSMTL
jgi:hypothetical protein